MIDYKSPFYGYRRGKLCKDAPGERLEKSCSVEINRQAIDNLAWATQEKIDCLLKDAVSRFFGHNNWVMEDLIGRATLDQFPGGERVFSLDGVALIELYPLDFEVGEKEGRKTISTLQRYRVLACKHQADKEEGSAQ